jgi:hypothetical protein
VQLLNWSGALIGPGFEWFWTTLQLVVVAATLIGLHRQLRLPSRKQAIELLRGTEVAATAQSGGRRSRH